MSGTRAVLFDVDGTLVDTTYLHTVCWSEALRGNGHVVAMSSVHNAIGMGSGELLDLLVGKDRDIGGDDAIITAHLALYRQCWGRLEPLPGARDLLRHCAKQGLDVVLASSASSDELDALRAALDCEDAIAAATSSADAAAAKPAPDLVAAALDKGGVAAEDAVFVGDAVWDGAAARRAGVTFVAVTCGGTHEAALRDAGAKEIYSDPAHLLREFDSSALSSD